MGWSQNPVRLTQQEATTCGRIQETQFGAQKHILLICAKFIVEFSLLCLLEATLWT